MKTIIISASGLTGNIYAGHSLKNKPVFAASKQDVTIDALVAVANHVIYFGAPVVISKADGTPEFEITVKKL